MVFVPHRCSYQSTLTCACASHCSCTKLKLTGSDPSLQTHPVQRHDQHYYQDSQGDTRNPYAHGASFDGLKACSSALPAIVGQRLRPGRQRRLTEAAGCLVLLAMLPQLPATRVVHTGEAGVGQRCSEWQVSVHICWSYTDSCHPGSGSWQLALFKHTDTQTHRHTDTQMLRHTDKQA